MAGVPDQTPQVTEEGAAETHLSSIVQGGDGREEHVGTEADVNKADSQEKKVYSRVTGTLEVLPEKVQEAERVEGRPHHELSESHCAGYFEVSEALEVRRLDWKGLSRVFCHCPIMLFLVSVLVVLVLLLKNELSVEI